VLADGQAESLGRFPAVLLPACARLDDAQVERLRQYVRQGGLLIALGQASMLDGLGRKRKNYALSDVFGARYKGAAVAGRQRSMTVVKVDSEYSREFRAANLVDGLPTAWASGGTPMPHWAEIILGEAVDVSRVELVTRQGPYRVTDVDFEAHDGKSWKLFKKVRNAPKRLITAALDSPVRTRRVRIRILKELYEGKDRQYADVEAVRIYDKTGRERATNRASVPLTATTKEAKQALAGGVGIAPAVVRLEPTEAEVLAKLDAPGQWPAVLRNRFGKGQAVLVAAGESSLRNNPAFWTALRKLALPVPTVECGQLDRYLIVLTRVADGHVLHVVDRHAARKPYKPQPVRVTLTVARLGGIGQPKAVSGRLLKTTSSAGRITLEILADPAASIVLR
jgi:hypothetical protein